jgi:hypothetical protein
MRLTGREEKVGHEGFGMKLVQAEAPVRAQGARSPAPDADKGRLPTMSSDRFDTPIVIPPRHGIKLTGPS